MEGTQRAVGWMSGDHDRCFLTLVLEAFRQVFFNTNALPCITIGVDVWGKSGIMTGVYLRWCSSALHVGTGSVLGSMSSSHL